MIIIGEKLNSSIPKTMAAMSAKDETAITGLIVSQTRAGAHYLDINTAMLGEDEMPVMGWVISLALSHSKAGIMIDSQNPKVVENALECCKDRNVIINSVTSEPQFEPVIALAAEKNCGLLCMPKAKASADEIIADARSLVQKVLHMGVKPENIYIDAVAAAIASDDQAGKKLLRTVSELHDIFPDCHIVCGLSNISFGMPGRIRLNATLLAMASVCGLDSVIMDPLNDTMRETVAAIRLLSGNDSYGMRYIGCMRGEMPGDEDEDELDF